MTVTYVLILLLLVFQTFMLLRLVLPLFPTPDASPVTAVRSLSFRITDPVVVPLRRSLPPLPGSAGGFGLAELVVLIALSILLRILTSI